MTNGHDYFDKNFVFSSHVETVVCLGNKNAKPKDYVEIGVDAEDHYRVKGSGKDQNKRYYEESDGIDSLMKAKLTV